MIQSTLNWTSVNDALPEIGKTVLVATNNGNVMNAIYNPELAKMRRVFTYCNGWIEPEPNSDFIFPVNGVEY